MMFFFFHIDIQAARRGEPGLEMQRRRVQVLALTVTQHVSALSRSGRCSPRIYGDSASDEESCRAVNENPKTVVYWASVYL